MGDQVKTKGDLLKELAALRARLNKMERAKRPAPKKPARAKRTAGLPGRREPTAQTRSQFLSYIAHELKTPLNSLLGFIQLLRSGTFGALTPEQSQAMTRMSINVLEIVHLINNILDFSKIDSDKMSVQVMATRPQELVGRVSMMFEPFLREKGLQLEQMIDPDCPTMLMTDPLKIKSVLINLLSNAIKFTTQGGIRIDLLPLSGQRGIRLSVSDTGIGMAPQDLEKIFKEHERELVRESAAPYGGGTGLGLAIVKKWSPLSEGPFALKVDWGRGRPLPSISPKALLLEGGPPRRAGPPYRLYRL